MPKPEGAAPEPSDGDGWALLDALRRKLDDQQIQTRKTAAQVAQLAESIAALVELQRKRSRWLNLNSFVAYCVFTVLLGGAFYFVYQSRARELVRASEQAAGERDAAVRRADEANAKLAARDAQLAKEREVAAVKPKPAEPSRSEAAIAAARASIKAGRFAEPIAQAESALAAEPSGAHAAELHYLLGIVRARLGEFDQALPHFEAAVAGNVADDDARFQLASALDRIGQAAKARVEYDRFAAEHPQSPFAVFAQRRSAALAHPAPPPAPAAAGSDDGSAAAPQ